MTLSRATMSLLIVYVSACSPVEDPSLYPAFDPADAAPIPDKTQSQFNPQRNLYWGDLHIHTGLSSGAWFQGVRTRPDDAYIYARGGEIRHPAGYGIQAQQPMDFAAVTDHAEYLGVLLNSNVRHPLDGSALRDKLLNNGQLANTWMIVRTLLNRDINDYDLSNWRRHTSNAWQETIESANAHNLPGRFTAFIGYEWTSMPDGQNLHRNVIYRSDDVGDLPFSANDSEDPRDLWTVLEKERAQGKDNLVIPHNGNLSDGRMYDAVMYDGGHLDSAYAERRMRNEPLSEIYQVKGSSETHPALSPQDAFADFEIYDEKLSTEGGQSQPEGSYLRDALRLGIELSHNAGFNPYRFGAIGGTDGHNSSSPTEENNYHGKLPVLDGTAGIRLRTASFMPEEVQGGPGWSSGGFAAIWAEENTREALFDAMRRKETYATSGPRIAVRFFGGWGYGNDLLERPTGSRLPSATGFPWAENSLATTRRALRPLPYGPCETRIVATWIGYRLSRAGRATTANQGSVCSTWPGPVIGS